ncbi:MAG: hypothetical protein ABSH50_07300 [Bryobacteraceae bacterium]|jgi:hypothetical protein
MARKKRTIHKNETAGDENVQNSTPYKIDVDPAEGGQAGDLQGLSGMPGADSESVRELLEEGQAYEAGIVSGVENAPPADAGEIHTRELPQDDVPLEYVERNRDEPKE